MKYRCDVSVIKSVWVELDLQEDEELRDLANRAEELVYLRIDQDTYYIGGCVVLDGNGFHVFNNLREVV